MCVRAFSLNIRKLFLKLSLSLSCVKFYNEIFFVDFKDYYQRLINFGKLYVERLDYKSLHFFQWMPLFYCIFYICNLLINCV